MAASAEDSGVWAVGMEEGRAWWRGMWQAENLERLVALEKMRLSHSWSKISGRVRLWAYGHTTKRRNRRARTRAGRLG
jgi:hypothetical protein